LPRTHQETDARSLAMHRLVAEKIRRDPALLEIAKAKLIRSRRATPNDYYFDEWARLLDAGLDAALAVATEDSEKATALRQSSPFAGVLTPEERRSFLDEWARTHRDR